MDVSVKSDLMGDRIMLALPELIIFQCTILRLGFEGCA